MIINITKERFCICRYHETQPLYQYTVFWGYTPNIFWIQKMLKKILGVNPPPLKANTSIRFHTQYRNSWWHGHIHWSYIFLTFQVPPLFLHRIFCLFISMLPGNCIFINIKSTYTDLIVYDTAFIWVLDCNDLICAKLIFLYSLFFMKLLFFIITQI